MNIELRKIKGVRDKLAIYVDGRGWGWAVKNSHGAQGISYCFRSNVSGLIRIPYEDGGKRWSGSNRHQTHVFTVYSDKIAARHLKDGETLAPFDQRLRDGVRFLIENGHLKNPDEERADVHAANERFRLAREQREREARAKVEAKARETLKALRGYGALREPNADDVKTICDLIEWAKHQ